MIRPFCVTLAALALMGLRVPCAFAEELAPDPALVSGELDNGLHYVIRKCALPPGRAVVWVHMHTGSMNETDRQRGIAHYLEHMAFNGSENFAPGTIVPFFQSMGMTFGRDQNAFTNMEQTTYQLSLPHADAESLGKGMMFFSDVVGRLLLSEKEVEAERQIIQEERRRGLGGRQRTGDYLMEHMTPGSVYGQRDTIGLEETINGVKPTDFRDYYGKWYSASNATLMVVADQDPEVVAKVIKEQFGSLPKKPRPTPQDQNITPYDKSFALVASDPEVRGESLRIVRVSKPRPPITTVEQYRDELVLRLASSAFNDLMGDKVARGGTSFTGMRIGAGNDSGVMWTWELSCQAKPEKWKEALNDMALELQRARAFGFSGRELADQKKNILVAAERAVETESSTTSQDYVSRLNNYVTTGDIAMSPTQRLELLKKLLPTITDDEVAKKFAAEFDPGAVCFIAVMPAGPNVPSESQLLEMGIKALNVTPTRDAEVEHATTLMAEAPAGGKFVDGAEHAETGIWTGWLDNNICVHYRFMDREKDQVSIQIALIGGEMLEAPDNRGITSAAQLAWAQRSTQHLNSGDVRELMQGKKINVRGGGGGGPGGRGGGRRGGGGGGGAGDSITLNISGAPEELETGFQLAYLLLTEPKIEASAFEDFEARTKQFFAEGLRNPMMVGMRTAGSAPYPESDARFQPVTPEQIDSLTLPAAQAWLDKLIKTSPIEVSIVGDVDRQKVLDLTARYLGSLSKRDRVGPDLFASVRHVQRPTGARTFSKVVDTPTKQAFVFSGFYGADESNRADARALNMAARVLSTRMVKEVREEAQLVYSMGASSRAASTYPGFGVFSASAPTDPSKAEALVAKISSMYEAFAKDGPSEDEMVVARKQFATNYEEQMKEPAFWMGRMNQMVFRGVDIDDFMKEPGEYEKLTAAQVHDTFVKYYSKDNAIVVVVMPQGDGAAEGATGAGGDK